MTSTTAVLDSRRGLGRSTLGSGLGLSLVAAVASLHDAELVLGDNTPGLVAVLRFPVVLPTTIAN